MIKRRKKKKKIQKGKNCYTEKEVKKIIRGERNGNETRSENKPKPYTGK